jgi:peptidoglycan/LPS O-acetylase OafA/YrhL
VLLGVWTLVMALFHDQTWMGATPSGDGTGRTIDPAGALRDLGIAVVYLANWNVIAGGMEMPLSHLWSLAVEEQFYLVWPGALLGLLLLGHRARLAAVGLLIAVSALLPFLYWNGGAGQERIYFGTDTRAVGLLMGAFAALVWHQRVALGRVARFGLARAALALAALVALAFWKGETPWKFTVMPLLLALLVAQVVPHLAENRGWLNRVLSVRWLVWMGKRSYGLYLWQYVWATWTHPYGTVGIVLGVVATFVTTELSWRLVEAPVLRYGRRFAVAKATPRSAAPPRLAPRLAA